MSDMHVPKTPPVSQHPPTPAKPVPQRPRERDLTYQNSLVRIRVPHWFRRWLNGTQEALAWRHPPLPFVECPNCRSLVIPEGFAEHLKWHEAWR